MMSTLRPERRTAPAGTQARTTPSNADAQGATAQLRERGYFFSSPTT
jgi:hypothetical protein